MIDPATASEALDQVRAIVTGSRRKSHGEAERSFGTISTFWTAYLGHPVSPADVCRMMALLKVARAVHGADPDHDIDMIGYGALAVEMEAANRDSDK